MIFSVEMLPAREGDCLWIEYGDPDGPRRILIDGGRGRTDKDILRQLKKLKQDRIHLELLVITHVDQDHIEGILNLLQLTDRRFTFGDIWFNGWRHLDESEAEVFGPVAGESLTTILLDEELPWNEAFDARAVVLQEDAPLPILSLPGGMKLTLLSPTRRKLADLKPKWEDCCRDAGIDPNRAPRRRRPPPEVETFGPLDLDSLAGADFDPDDTEANGSTIALLAEFEGRRLLLAGDAHPDALLDGIRLAAGGGKLRLDAFKLPHHGSKANLSRAILDAVECPRYLVSTSGARYRHPDAEAMARVIKFGGPRPELVFNYRSPYSTLWDNPLWMADHGYSVRYLPDPAGGRKVALL
jgi:hypothetical protein